MKGSLRESDSRKEPFTDRLARTGPETSASSVTAAVQAAVSATVVKSQGWSPSPQ
ncbi:hypothetical protein GCM10027360_49330 [Amycolatopsis echigonensis]